jgi:hypothetical protein
MINTAAKGSLGTSQKCYRERRVNKSDEDIKEHKEINNIRKLDITNCKVITKRDVRTSH